MKMPIHPQLIGNIPNSTALAHYVATHPTLFEKGVFVIVEHPTDRRILASSIPNFIHGEATPKVLEWNGQIHLLPQLLQYDIIVSDRKTIESTLLPAPSILERQTIRIAKGETHELAQLKEKLTNMGFERDKTATRQGTFSIRGDILDIHTDRAYRASFFGDTIEKVETLAGPEFTPDKTTDTPVLIAPMNSRGRSSLYDYIPDYKDLLAYNTELPEGIEEARPEGSVIRAEVLALASDAPNAKLQTDNPAYTLPKSYHLRRDDLLEDISKAQRTIIFTEDRTAITNLITENNSPLPGRTEIYEADTLNRGFVFAGVLDSREERNRSASKVGSGGNANTGNSSLLCLTDADIGLVEKRQKKASKKLQKALLQELHPGDYVVHLHHGVAKFNSVQTMHVNNLDREYFVLEYAGRDKIYVPVELADRLDKYIGAENPELQKLSGASWHTAMAAVAEDAARIAQELLDIYARRTTANAHHILPHPDERRLDEACPYDLTVDQQDALEQIFEDIKKDQPMDRLLCGDVGFGKTEVALRAAYRAVLNGYQVAILAPTTILTQQHFDTFTERLKEMGVNVGSLSRFQSKAEQKEVVEGLKSGKVDIVVGTHRLFSSDISFKQLGLIVIDEEQRFGVKAKETLTALRATSHVLTMTATPIPRTLHLSLSGIRAISTILTPPQERKSVELSITPMNNDVITLAVQRELARKGQVYYVYNRVQSIERRRMELQTLLGDDVRIVVAHGQMRPADLSDVMHRFDTGQIDVLLASSIVENGLDVATANTMIVENASMFGLAELYQLKGRVGRSHEQGYCYFLYKERVLDGDVKERFLALQASTQLGAGFELAMRDMEIRGVGNMLGKEQHGHASKIGLHLYVRLLNTAVQQLQGKNPEVLREVAIDLPLEGRIPEELIPNTEERIYLYQQLANITDVTELADARRDLMKMDGLWNEKELHPAVEGYLQLLEVKILASRSELLSINTDYPNEMNRLTSVQITVTADSPLPDLPPEWERVYDRSHMALKARTTLAQLGDDWISALKQVIRLCSTQVQ